VADRAGLRCWIQPQHLSDDTLERYRCGLAAHPARLVVVPDFLDPAVADRLSTFLRCEAEFGPEYGLYSAGDVAASEAAYVAAPEEDRFFRYRRLVAAAPEHALSPNAVTYLQFRKAFQSEDLRRFFEELAGIALGPSDDFGAHAMRAGDFLRPHSDSNRSRRLAIVLYLSPAWPPAYGGALEVVDGGGGRTVVEATYNTLVAFDVLADTVHAVLPVEPAAGDHPRVSIGGWYPQPAGG
jgi:hypothetical protein